MTSCPEINPTTFDESFTKAEDIKVNTASFTIHFSASDVCEKFSFFSTPLPDSGHPHAHLQWNLKQEEIPSTSDSCDPTWIQQRVLIQGQGQVGSEAGLESYRGRCTILRCCFRLLETRRRSETMDLCGQMFVSVEHKGYVVV